MGITQSLSQSSAGIRLLRVSCVVSWPVCGLFVCPCTRRRTVTLNTVHHQLSCPSASIFGWKNLSKAALDGAHEGVRPKSWQSVFQVCYRPGARTLLGTTIDPH